MPNRSIISTEKAPKAIGTYSQAVKVGDTVYLSGQIPLDPKTMMLATGNMAMAVYALIALAPAGMAIMLAHAVRQGAGLAAETRRARELCDASDADLPWAHACNNLAGLTADIANQLLPNRIQTFGSVRCVATTPHLLSSGLRN